MAMTNAERQKKYREQRKASGMKRSCIWFEGGAGIAGTTEIGSWSQITKAQLDGAIKKAVECFKGQDEFMKEVVYADLAAYAEIAAARFHRYAVTSDKILNK